MYGATTYSTRPYGADSIDAGDIAIDVIAAPLISNAFQLFAPGVSAGAEGTLAAPLISNAMQVFPPASVEVRGRPLAEDTRSMSVAGQDVRRMRVKGMQG